MLQCGKCSFSNEDGTNFCIQCWHDLKDAKKMDTPKTETKKNIVQFEISTKLVVTILILVSIWALSYAIFHNLDKIQARFSGIIGNSPQTSLISSGSLWTGSSDMKNVGNVVSSVKTGENITPVKESTVSEKVSQMPSKEEIDTLAKEFLSQHYHAIETHNFWKAFANYSQWFINERTRGKADSIYRSLETFSTDWMSMKKIDIENFQIGSRELNYTYKVIITKTNGTDIYLTDMQLIRKGDGGFQIASYGSAIQK